MQCISDPNIIIMRIDKLADDPQVAKKLLIEAEHRFHLKHKNIIQMPDFSFVFKIEPLKHAIISSYFEYANWDLQRELDE